MFQYLAGKMSNDGLKVRIDPYGRLEFAEATSNSTDPLVILLRTVLEDGKLGTKSVDKNAVHITEIAYGKNDLLFSLCLCRGFSFCLRLRI